MVPWGGVLAQTRPSITRAGARASSVTRPSVYPPASLIKDTLSLIKDVCFFSVDSFQDGMLGPTTTFTWFFYVISEKTRSILYGTAGKCSKNNFGLS